MSNPTTPFGWQMPTATDLVTDLPADFEVFGQAVATSMGDLLGGTSGQVLAKNSNTDMDFVWVTSDDANAIQNTIVDAKGDLIAATAADTPARLAVGSNGETLVADSSTSTGLRYQAPIQQNPVLNSAMQVWQRGTSVAVSGAFALTYAADRWGFFRTGFATGMTVSRQVTGDTTNLPFIQYAQRVQRDSGNTSTGIIYTLQNFESINSIPFAGKTVTFSFYARAGANYSAASSALSYNVSTGTGTDQNLLNGYTGQANPISTTATLTTTWQRFTATAALSSSATQVGVGFNYTPVGTAGANDYFEVTGVQLEVGSVATPFHTYAATIQGELAACQRYYWRQTSTVAYGALSPYGTARGSTAAGVSIKNAVTMRVYPSSMEFANVALYDGTTIYAITGFTITYQTPDHTYVEPTVASGLTAGKPYAIFSNNNAAGYIAFNAEL
jgi:hypothetical protein